MANTAVIAGIGPGFGESLAHYLSEEGYDIAVLSRSGEYLDSFTTELAQAGIDAIGVPTDITQPDQVSSAFDEIERDLGTPELLSIQASQEGGWATIEDLTPESFKQAWDVYGYGTFLCAAAAVEHMRAAGGGTIMIVGVTADYGMGTAHGFASACAAKRAFAESLASEVGPDGIHVVHVGIDGVILNPDIREATPEPIDRERYIDPDSAARVCTSLLTQDAGAWTTSVDLRAPIDDRDAILSDLFG